MFMNESLLKQIRSTKKFEIMKQLLLAIIASAAISFSATAQSTYSRYNGEKWEQLGGSGKLVQLNTPVAAFSNVEISHMNVQVVVESNTQTCALEVSIDDNLKDFFRYKVEGATLKLSMDLSGGKYKRWLSSNNTVVTIKAPSLQVLSNKGNTSITVKEMKQSSFNLISDGNADISLTGSSNEFYLHSHGNSDIDAGKFVTHKTTINTTGNSEIRVNAKELVEQNVKGNVEIVNEYNMPSASVTVKKESITEMVRFKLRNNSILPSKVIVISYRPDEKGNGTTAFVMMPYGTRTYRFPAGTKIYLASQQQVNTVMSGAKISDQPPFLTVKKEDNNQTFNIND